jgi:hypothetical protein
MASADANPENKVIDGQKVTLYIDTYGFPCIVLAKSWARTEV